MLRIELVENDTRVRQWSDLCMMIRQIETGILYEDAVDIIPCHYTYEETDIPIPEEEEEPNFDEEII